MNDHDQLREQMWDLVYGLTTAEETAALHARIKSDPKIARLYAEVSLESDLLAQAARVEATVSLPEVAPPGDKPAAGRAKKAAAASSSSSSRMALSLHWVGAIAASALAVLLAVGIFARSDKPLAEPTELVSLKVYYNQGDALVSGLAQEIELETRDAGGNPRAVPLTTQIAGADNQPRYEYKVETDALGRASMPLPADALSAGAKLRVLHETELLAEAPLPIRDEPLETRITLDREWYERGDVVRWRAVNLSAFTHQAKDAQFLSFQLQAPDAQTIGPQETVALAGTGIVTGEFQLPSDAEDGLYALTVQSTPHSEPETEAIVSVGREVALQPQAETFRRSRRGGMGTQLDLAMRDDARFAGGGLGGRGAGVRDGAFRAGDGESKRQLAPRSEAPPPADFALRPAPTKTPAPATAPAESARAPSAGAPGDDPKSAAGNVLAEQLAQNVRKAMSELEPADKREVAEVELLGDRDSLELAIPPEAEGKKLSIETRYRNLVLGKIQVPAAEDETLSDGGESAAGKRVGRGIQVPLPAVTGEVEVTLFDDSASIRRPLLTERVMRMPRNQFDIDVGALKESYAPGEKVQLTVAVKDNIGQQPIGQAMLGVNVRPSLGDELVTGQLELGQQMGRAAEERDFAKLEADQKAVKSLTPGLAGKAKEIGGVKQKLATQPSADDLAGSGSHVDAPAGPAAPSSAGGGPAGGGFAAPEEATPEGLPQERTNSAVTDRFTNSPLAALPSRAEPNSGPKLLVSNEAQVQRVLQKRTADKAEQQARFAHWKGMIGRWLLAGGVVMLLVLAVAFAVQRPASARVWVPAFGIAAASFIVGFVWILNQPRTAQTVAQNKSFSEAAGVQDAESSPPASPAAGSSPFAPSIEPSGPSVAAGMSETTSEATDDLAAKEAPSPAASTDGALEAPAEAPQQFFDRRRDGSRSDVKAGQKLESVIEKSKLPQANETPATPKLARGMEDAQAVRMRSAQEDRTSIVGGIKERSQDEALKKDGPQPPAPRQGLNKNLAASDLDKLAEKQAAGKDQDKKDEQQRHGELNESVVRAKQLSLLDRQPHTVVWQPLLRADENGQATIEFTMPEVPGDYRLVLDVHGNGRIGKFQLPLRCEAPPAAAARAAAEEAKP